MSGVGRTLFAAVHLRGFTCGLIGLFGWMHECSFEIDGFVSPISFTARTCPNFLMSSLLVCHPQKTLFITNLACKKAQCGKRASPG
jgi:hypothetical protein